MITRVPSPRIKLRVIPKVRCPIAGMRPVSPSIEVLERKQHALYVPAGHTFVAVRASAALSPHFPVRPDGAYHQWRRVPPGELSIAPVADERFGRATDWAG